MKTATAMTIARFAELAEAYGGDIEAWPEADRAAAHLTAAGSEQVAAKALLSEASALDDALALALGPASAPSEELMARVLKDAAATQETFSSAAPSTATPRSAAGRRDRRAGPRSGAGRSRSVHGRPSAGQTRRVASIFATAAVAGFAMGLFIAPAIKASSAGGANVGASGRGADPMTDLMLVEFDGGFEDFLDG